MEKIDLTQIAEDGSFTIKLEGPPGLIAADTLSETVAGFRQSLRAINAAVAPYSMLEVFVTGITLGSVNIGIRLKRHFKKNAKAYVTAVATIAASAIPVPAVSNIIVGLLTNLLYDQIKPQEKDEIVIDDDKVTIIG